MGLQALIVQHAEKQPRPGDPGLTATGRGQATLTARWLAGTEPATAIWSSPMRRAQETAEVIAERLDLAVTTDVRLRERMNWTGGEGTIEQFLSEWKRASADRDYVPHHGDSSTAAATRFLAALSDVAAAGGSSGPVVVVTHGGVTTDTLRSLLGDDELSTRAPNLIEDGVPCCAITTLEQVEDAWEVRSIAVTAHLAPDE